MQPRKAFGMTFTMATLVASATTLMAALALTPVWTGNNQQADFTFYGSAVAVAGDVNGDGFGEVIVGSNAWPGILSGIGRAFIYYGNAGGASTLEDWTATGTDLTDTFAESVAGAGDVNGDGYGDVIIGAQHAGASNGGRAYVFHGSAGGLNITPAWSNLDVEVDGSEYGETVAAAGDVNGDGYDDIIVGSPHSGEPSSGGKAFAYFGSASGLSATPDWVYESDAEFAALGDVVSGGGDVNGDGYDDVIIGAPGYPGADGFPAGAAFVFLGSAAGPSLVPDWSALAPPDNVHAPFPQGGFFGESVWNASDFNGDGFDDVAVGFDYSGSQSQQGEGKVFVYYGSASGPATTAGKEIEGNKANAVFGQKLSGADVNGDGFGDLIVAAPRWASTMSQEREGALFVFYGSVNGPNTKKFTRIEGNQAGALFADAVGSGDVNGDGRADVVVGATTDGTLPPSSERAFLFLGTPGLP